MRHFGKRVFALFLALMFCVSLSPAAMSEGVENDGNDTVGTIAPLPEPDASDVDVDLEEDAGEGSFQALTPQGDEIQAETSGECGDSLIWTISDAGVLTIAGSGEMWDWSPARGLAPWSEHSIVSVVIMDGVTSIGSFAFYSCGLTSVSIPESVTSIGGYAFELCSGLTAVTIPKSVTDFGRSIFSDCEDLKEIVFGGTKEQWIQAASDIYDHYAVTVRCSDGDIAAADPGFCGYDLIWTLSNGVLTIAGSGDMWKWDCTSKPWNSEEITSLRILPGVTGISDFAFSGCRNLTSVSFPESLTYIGVQCFTGCSLGSVTIPAKVTNEAAYSAFQYNAMLTEILVAEGNIAYCSIDGILYDKDVKTLYCCPAGKTGEHVIPQGVVRVCSQAFVDSSLSGLSIPDSVVCLDYFSFGYSQLKSIQFDGPAPTFGTDVFDNVTAAVRYPAWEPSWTEDVRQNYGGTITWIPYGPVAFGQCGDDLNWVLDADGDLTISGTGEMWSWTGTEAAWPSTPWQAMVSRISSVRIEPGVTDIGDFAFYGCQNMTGISIAETVTQIGVGAFCACSGLLSLTIPEGVTGIGERAFNSCYSMTNIRLPASLSQIGDQLLSSCTGLTDVYYGGTMAEWKDLDADYDPYKVTVHCADGDLSPADTAYCGDDLIWSLSSSGTLTIAGSGDMWDFGYGQAPWNSRSSEIKQLRLTSGVTSIGNYAFYYCRQLCSVTLPESLTRVGDSAFAGCESLLALTLPDTVTSIGASAFCQTSLYSFVIPEGVKSIEKDTFCACPYLSTVVIPETVTEIGETAFYNCFELAEVTIPEGVTSLGYAAFSNCCNLESITIPASVTSMGAFGGCSSLTSIDVDPANANYSSDDGVLFNKDKTVLLQCPEGKSGDYSIPETVKEIKSSAFSNCEKLISVTIRSGVTSIQDGFFRCSSLERIDVAPDNANYSSDDGVLFNKDKSVLLRYPGGKSGKYSIPMGVKEINLGAFRFCEQLTGVTIPASVNRIGFLAFANDSGLRDIYFLGAAPVFVGNTEDGAQYQFGGVTATAYYPAGDPSWTESVRQNYGGRITWVAYEPGDMNGDAEVDSLDLMLLRKQLVGLPAEGSFNPAAADLNGDGTVDILDLVRLRKLMA